MLWRCSWILTLSCNDLHARGPVLQGFSMTNASEVATYGPIMTLRCGPVCGSESTCKSAADRPGLKSKSTRFPVSRARSQLIRYPADEK